MSDEEEKIGLVSLEECIENLALVPDMNNALYCILDALEDALKTLQNIEAKIK